MVSSLFAAHCLQHTICTLPGGDGSARRVFCAWWPWPLTFELDLQTCPSEGPNTSSGLWIWHKSVQPFPRHWCHLLLHDSAVFRFLSLVTLTFDLDSQTVTRPCEGSNTSSVWIWCISVQRFSRYLRHKQKKSQTTLKQNLTCMRYSSVYILNNNNIQKLLEQLKTILGWINKQELGNYVKFCRYQKQIVKNLQRLIRWLMINMASPSPNHPSLPSMVSVTLMFNFSCM